MKTESQRERKSQERMLTNSRNALLRQEEAMRKWGRQNPKPGGHADSRIEDYQEKIADLK